LVREVVVVMGIVGWGDDMSVEGVSSGGPIALEVKSVRSRASYLR